MLLFCHRYSQFIIKILSCVCRQYFCLWGAYIYVQRNQDFNNPGFFIKMIFPFILSDKNEVKMKRIIFTGGGTAGHVFPNLALIEALPQDKWSVHYLGICSGIEHKLIEEWNMKHRPNIVFHSIEGGKFRRNLSMKNVSDIFKISKGYKSSMDILENIQPHIMFSKGGYVSVPPSYAAHRQHVPVITHESDLSIGLANKLINRVADTICTSFPIENSDRRTIFTGNPIRQSILLGKKNVGRHKLSF